MTVRAVVVGAALLVCALAVRAQQPPEALAQLDGEGRWVNGVTESWWVGDGITEADAAGAAARWKEVGDELARAGAAGSAGDYFRGGDTGGTYMRWSPNAGFVIADVSKCEARVRAVIHGRVRATPTLVEFVPEVYRVPPRKRDGEEQQPATAKTPAVIRYVPVEWRGERLLIEEGEMEGFGDYLAGLGEYNGRPDFLYDEHTSFFTRFEVRAGAAGASDSAAPFNADDSAANVSGTDKDSGEDGSDARAPHTPPVVPPGYERFLKKPVEATVTAVGRRSLKRDYLVELPYNSFQYNLGSFTRVTISAGTAQGVKDRTVFRVTEPDEGDTVIVLRAGENESEAIVVREVNERGGELFYENGSDREKRHSKVAAGWKLTTSPF